LFLFCLRSVFYIQCFSVFSIVDLESTHIMYICSE